MWVNGRLAGEHDGRLHPVLRRHHRISAAGRSADRRLRARRTIRPISPSRAASRTGSSTPLHLVSAHHRHLADGLAGTRPGDLDRAPRAGRPNLERWEIGFEALARRRARATTCASTSSCTRGDTLLARRHLHGRRRRSPPPHRALRSRASTTIATSCCGAPSTPTLIECELELLERARRTASTACAATRRCARSACRATGSSSTAGPTSCAWCSIRATGPTRA